MSSNFDFFNVDAHEFEEICAEVLSIYLGKQFRVFPEGPDGGVDIKQVSGSQEIIGQAKRYKDPSKLPIDNELNKLKAMVGVKSYYFFVACPLTSRKRKEIYEVFKDYMSDESFVFDSLALNGLLGEDKYLKVLNKHFRLWSASEEVLQRLVSDAVNFDTNVFKANVQHHRKYYVETDEYRKALKIFEASRIILLKGAAGIGKTTTSEMLVLAFLNEHPEARFIYSSSGNVESLKQSLSSNPELIELVLIDDFLGDIYLNLQSDKIKGVISFIEHFKHSKNKYLIINSRIVILEEAKYKQIGFEKTLDDIGVKQIDLSGLSKNDKARILFNHMYFSEIPDVVKKEFLDKKLYVKIVEHQNYNPRLIESICNNKRFTKSGLSFENFVKEVLEKQEESWDHAFNRNLDEVDRILLLVLYSLGSYWVRQDFLECAFIYETKNDPSIDRSKNVFSQSLKRLTDAFVKIYLINNHRYVSFLNPSVKECVMENNRLFHSDSDFMFFDQYIHINGAQSFATSTKFLEMINNDRISKLSFAHYESDDAYILFFANNDALDKKLESTYLHLVSKETESIPIKVLGNSNTYDYFKRLLDGKYLSFYDTTSLSFDDLLSLALNCVKFLDAAEIANAFAKMNNPMISKVLSDSRFKTAIIQKAYSDYDLTPELEASVFNDPFDGSLEFDGKEARRRIAGGLFDEINDSYYSLFEKCNLVIDESDVIDFLEGEDLETLYDNYQKPDDGDDDYIPKNDNFECYEIFNSLLR